MRGKGGDLVGRWPWGMWLALVGVSAGTVASFALVGWSFMAISGGSEADGPAEGWDGGDVVIEAPAEPTVERSPGPEEGPTTQERPTPEPESAPVEPTPEPSPESEPATEPVPESGREDPRLVLVEESSEHRPEESHPGDEEDSNCSDESAQPELVLEHSSGPWARSKE